MKIMFEDKVIDRYPIKINGKIKAVLDLYAKLKVPAKALLTDFLAVKSKGNELADAENPWEYYYKEIEGREVESGVSVEESAFRFGAMELRKQKPTDVINAAFYSNKQRNDTDFEMSYVIPIFVKMLNGIDKALIVNPTPDIICYIEGLNPECQMSYCVVDDVVTGLYKIQFPMSEFYSFEQCGYCTTYIY